jgi:hypothetical protein
MRRIVDAFARYDDATGGWELYVLASSAISESKLTGFTRW